MKCPGPASEGTSKEQIQVNSIINKHTRISYILGEADIRCFKANVTGPTGDKSK